jgi:hypothetical protein
MAIPDLGSASIASIRRSALLPAAAIAVIAAVPFLGMWSGAPSAHDLPDHLAMAACFRQDLSEGCLLPRWYGSFNDGWGEATGLFYPPGLYYLTALSAWMWGGDILAGLLSVLAVLTAVGMAGVYRLARPPGGRMGAVLACILFAIVPFRSFELYAAGLYSAYAAGCILPWLLLALHRLAAHPEEAPPRTLLDPVAGWAASVALIALLNLPATVLAAYLVAAWLAVETILRRSRRLPVRVLLGAAWGGLAAAAYLVPAAVERSSVALADLGHGGKPAHASNFVFQREGSWMSPDLLDVFTRMALYPALALVAGVIVLLAVERHRATRPVEGDGGSRLRLLACFGGGALFLATPLSEPLWSSLPFLESVNLPWRLLDHMAAPASVVAGAAAARLLRGGTSITLLPRAAGLTAIAALGCLCFLLAGRIESMNGRILPGQGPALARAFCGGTSHFLPRDAAPPNRLGPHPPVVPLSPGAEARVLEWRSTSRLVRTSSPVPARIALRTYWFPGWSARLATGAAGDSASLPVSAEPPSGRMIIDVPAGEHDVLVRFEATPLRSAAAATSIFSIAALLAALVGLSIGRRGGGPPPLRPTAGSLDPEGEHARRPIPALVD